MEKIQVHACFAKLVSEESNAGGARAKLRTERVPFEGCATTAAVFVVGEYWSFRWTLSGGQHKGPCIPPNSFKHWEPSQHGEIMEFA